MNIYLFQECHKHCRNKSERTLLGIKRQATTKNDIQSDKSETSYKTDKIPSCATDISTKKTIFT